MNSMYLDDERNPKTNRNWTIIRSVKEAKEYVNLHGIPNYISFDHDLGENTDTGYDFAKWLVHCDMSGLHKFPSIFEFNVHSANPVGSVNIRSLISSYLRFKGV